MTTQEFITAAFQEDVGRGDYSTLASIQADAKGKAVLKIKEEGILAGMQIAQDIFHYLEEDAKFTLYKKDGDAVKNGEIAFIVEATVHNILKAERLVLNCMQRMSGIATLTHKYANKIKDYKTRILDTRKTTPLFREYEKQAVRIGGGYNLRMGLYDMIMLKDNHIDFCGGIEQAIRKTNKYIEANNLNLKIEIETRNLDDVRRVISVGNVHRIMIDNCSPELLEKAIELIGGKYETEASGGINLDNIISYARTGVDYVSIGAITNRAVSWTLV